MKSSILVLSVFSAFIALTGFATTYTSESYVQRDHMVAQWDGINNAGTGTHDPTATTWKDLKGSLDMMLTGSARWKDGNSLVVSNCLGGCASDACGQHNVRQHRQSPSGHG